MEIKMTEVGGIGEYHLREENSKKIYEVEGRAFCVLGSRTVEVRTDRNLRKFLIEKYESVMESRYFGKGGVEIVLAGQLNIDEVRDLVRLSYNLTKSEKN